MATFRLHGERWQARVRRKGHPELTKSFQLRQDAERWARSVETAIDRGSFIDRTEAERTTLGDLIRRYMKEVLPAMKGAHEDAIWLSALLRRPVCDVSMARLTASHIADHRDQRLKEVAPGTVIRELPYLSSVINHARREWGINVINPVALVKRPSSPQGRDRLLAADELTTLLAQLEPTGRKSPWMKPLVLVALETGMRRGELLALKWADLNLPAQTATLWVTKNGDRRYVPLSSKAVSVLQSMPKSITGSVFPMNGFTVSKAFDVAVKRAGLKDLRFHDLRHTGITHLAEKLPNLIELVSVSGHRSLKMLQRYYHPKAEDLAKKLG